jgi:hypothetical protein
MNHLTPRSDKDLCASCSHVFVREGYHTGREVWCTWVSPRMKIHDATSHCGDYHKKNSPDAYELEKIAWIITGDPKGKVGFRAWSQMTKDEREELGVRRL